MCVSLYAKEWDLLCSFRHAKSICTIIPSCQCDLASWLQQCCERWNAHNHVAPENRVSQKRHFYIFQPLQHFQGKHIFVFGSFSRRFQKIFVTRTINWIFTPRIFPRSHSTASAMFLKGFMDVRPRTGLRSDENSNDKNPETSRMVASAFYRCPWRWQEAKSNFSGVSSPWSRYRLLKSACWTWDLGIRIK